MKLSNSRGRKIWEKYILHHPHYVLMDIQLKGITSFGTIEKNLLPRSHQNVVIVTSHYTLSFRKRAENYIKGFITKDKVTDINQLLQTITFKQGYL